MLKIPTFADPFYTVRVSLDGLTYGLAFQWSTVESRWYISLEDSEGNSLTRAQKIRSNWPLFEGYGGRARPPGRLAAIATDYAPPGLDDFGIGKRVQLCYFPEGEL